MAVLIEAISVVTRRAAIDAKYPGAWKAFVDESPNRTLCYDSDLARVGFMTPMDVGVFVEHLERNGMFFLVNGTAQDIAVVDQQQGPTTKCEWLEFARLPFGESGGTVSACWLFEGPRMGAGVHFRGLTMDLHTPPGWTFEDSLSKKFAFIPIQDAQSRLDFLRSENGVDVFLDRETGKEVFIGRTT